MVISPIFGAVMWVFAAPTPAQPSRHHELGASSQASEPGQPDESGEPGEPNETPDEPGEPNEAQSESNETQGEPNQTPGETTETSGFAQPSQANEEDSLEPDAPWSQGVSAEDRAKARELFRTGNGFFERDQYADALEYYREAVALWDHPAVHFNITVCLINLDQPVAAYEHLRNALRHGAEALGPHFHAQAITYQKLLLGRLARLEVSCSQQGATVTLDGKRVLSCPAKTSEYLLPGQHQLVAEKQGLPPLARSIDLRAGETHTETLELSPPTTAKRYERRWKVWVPWVPLASGVAVGLTGVGLRALAASDAEQFDREVARLCPQGCNENELPESVRQLRPRAAAKNAVAITMFAAGGATAVAGAVLLILNRQREVESTTPSVAALLGPDAAGLTVQGRF